MTTTSSGDLFADTPLTGQHAVITGGSRGIGAACADALARLGANVSLVSRSADALATKKQEIEAARGVKVATAVADVADPEEVETAFAAVTDTLGAPQILINNAGIGKSAPFHRTTLDFWQETMALNLTGPFLCTQQVYGAMREAKYGRIVNIASIVGLQGYAYIAAYAASKHGVVGLTRSLALEAAKSGITVNAVCPGYTDTDLVTEAVDNIVEKTGRSADDARAELASTSPIGRLITPEEVAETTAWLCLPSSSAITGQAIVVAGGAVQN